MVVNWRSFATDGVLEHVPPHFLPPPPSLAYNGCFSPDDFFFFLWPRQKLFTEMDYHISDIKLRDKKWTDHFFFVCFRKKKTFSCLKASSSVWKVYEKKETETESVFFKGQRTVSSSIEKILDLFSTRPCLEKKKYSFCVSFSFFCQSLDVFPNVKLISWGLYVLSLNVILFTRSSRSTVWQRSNT